MSYKLDIVARDDIESKYYIKIIHQDDILLGGGETFAGGEGDTGNIGTFDRHNFELLYRIQTRAPGIHYVYIDISHWRNPSNI